MQCHSQSRIDDDDASFYSSGLPSWTQARSKGAVWQRGQQESCRQERDGTREVPSARRVATLTFCEANDRLTSVFNFSESVSKSFQANDLGDAQFASKANEIPWPEAMPIRTQRP